MSFAFMPVYTGDYLRDTRHLTPLKHGIYILALMHCWDSKGPMPLDEQECAGICNCRSSDEIESLRYVLGKFFVRMSDGHYNTRMQREVERAEALSRKRSEAGRSGYEARAKHLPSKSQASASTPTPTPTPTTTTTKTNTARKRASTPAAPAGVSEVHWADWLKARKAKSLPLTETALEAVKREAAKANLTLPQAIQIAAENGWAGFKASWLLQPDVKGWKPGSGQIERPKEWHETASGVRAKGAEFGLFPSAYMLDDEREDWQAFKAAVMAAASKGVTA